MPDCDGRYTLVTVLRWPVTVLVQTQNSLMTTILAPMKTKSSMFLRAAHCHKYVAKNATVFFSREKIIWLLSFIACLSWITSAAYTFCALHSFYLQKKFLGITIGELGFLIAYLRLLKLLGSLIPISFSSHRSSFIFFLVLVFSNAGRLVDDEQPSYIFGVSICPFVKNSLFYTFSRIVDNSHI